jgi:hypothetical protein
LLLENISPVNFHTMLPSKKAKEIELKISLYAYFPSIFFSKKIAKDAPSFEAFAPKEGKV